MKALEQPLSCFTQLERRKRIERALWAVSTAIDKDDYEEARNEWRSLRIDLDAHRHGRALRERENR